MEGKPRIYENISPTIPTPAGGGHIPEVMIYRHPLNYGKKSIYETNGNYPTLRTVQRMPQIANTVDTSGWLREMGRHEIGKHGLTDYRIRRLTPIECERLQSFPDGWTEIALAETQKEADAKNRMFIRFWFKQMFPKGCLYEQQLRSYWLESISNLEDLEYYPVDGARYRVLGNAVTVNVVEFLGKRILSSITNKDAV